MWLYGVFNWFAANPVARWVAGIGAGLAALWAFMTLRDRRIRKDAKEEGKREVIERIETKEAELKDKANEAEDRITRELNERSLRELAARSPENLGPVRRD
jgi:flagellar biosynthesis/type III secretory pathway M-ring protein FliF/YscJ